MTDFPRQPERPPAWPQHTSWAVAIATALFVLLVAGVLPRVIW